ncbi:unnamed protein product [Ceutorhynchus assimilis]|uniref:Aminopeptidase n=1 Tax=Ceutorhynchus assimilis TaxID=467358 RepID=A0A9N9QSC9_9CUCU|nr:unnamed protein product [Ceutorhynchus assimilis]
MKTLGIFGLLICLSLGAHIKINDSDAAKYRLPTSILPIRYTIDLEFPGSAFTQNGDSFNGKVRITLKIVEATYDLKLHASNKYITIKNLNINAVEVAYTLDPDTDIVSVPIRRLNLKKDGTDYIEIEYTGIISTTDNYGVYKSTYGKLNKDTSYIIATQFEATYARRAFPCFDEPSFKAIFDVTISHQADSNLGLGVLFNTTPKPVQMVLDNDKGEHNNTLESRRASTTTKVTFESTPIISTYLIAFTISDFSSTAGANQKDVNVEHKVWSRDYLKSSRTYAAEVGPKLLNSLNKYTGRNYEDIKKIDQVALPDFAAGAMENWGLITYRERLLLWDEEKSPDINKQPIATVIAHELAHQWFGNLITCDWWSETYLNEGFATFFEYFTTHDVEKDWKLDEQFVVKVLQTVLADDSQGNSQAIKSEVSTPQQVDTKFGSISYLKGGSILKMLEQIMGAENFKAGVQAYVASDSLQYKTSTTSKLLNVFQTKVPATALPEGQTLESVMANWMNNPGYPLINVKLNGKTLTVSQERFLISGEDKASKWWVPLTMVESEGKNNFKTTTTQAWLSPTDTNLDITLENENNQWVLLNTFQTGFYRVNYEPALWTSLSKALQKDDFSGIVNTNRAQIIDDAFNIAKTGKITYSQLFEVIKFLKKDKSYISWYPAFTGFQYILSRVPSESELKAKMQQHLLSLMSEFYDSVPISQTKTGHVDLLSQSLAGSWACLLGQKTCVSEAQKLFAGLFNSESKSVDKNIKSIVYCTGLRYGDASHFEQLWNLYGETADSDEQVLILASLGCSSNSEKLTQLLTETLKDDSKVRSQDAATAFSAVYSKSDEGVEVALNFMIANFKQILVKYSAMSAKTTLIKGIAGKLTTTAQYDKLKSLLNDNTEFEGDLKDLKKEALELAEANLEWIKIHGNELNEYFGIDQDDDNKTNSVPTSSPLNSLVLAIIVSLAVAF